MIPEYSHGMTTRRKPAPAPEPVGPRPPSDRGQGRMSLVDGEATIPFMLRLPESVHVELMAAAAAERMTAAAFVREALRPALRRARRASVKAE